MRRLLNRCGPVFSDKEVALHLGVSTAKVRSMDTRGLFLGFDRAGRRHYPVWQFDSSVVRPWVAPLIQSLGGAAPALHFILVPRKSLGGAGTTQPYLTLVQTNNSSGVATMLQRAQDHGITIPTSAGHIKAGRIGLSDWSFFNRSVAGP